MWQPSASLANLKLRAHLLKQIRDFFAARNVLEVETPLLCHTSVTDPFIQSIPVLPNFPAQEFYYLQTSPEYAMKRLLAAGSGDIFQICKAFRQDEVGRLHNPEFTMLEWYRLGFDLQQLMDEMDELLQFTLKSPKAKRHTYAELFNSFLGIDPHTASLDELANCAKQHHIDVKSETMEKNTWLEILMSHCIEPQLDAESPHFIYNFPTSQAALARIIPGNPPVAARFEVHLQGMELANGFYELQNAKEQRKRFEENRVERKKLGLSDMQIDEFFLAALEHGLPDCSGVALGLDRLLIAATKSTHIREILSFDFGRV